MAEKRKTKNKRRILEKGESERNDGRFMYRYKDPFTEKTKCLYAPTLDELRQKEARINKEIGEKQEKLEQDKRDGIDTAAGEMTLNEMFKINMELKEDEIRASTRQNYLSMYASNVESSFIGTMKISELKQMHIIRFYKGCIKKGLSYSTTKLLHNLVFGTLETAVDNDFIRKNPAKNCLKKISNTTKEKIPLSADEVHRLLNYCKSSTMYSRYLPFLVIALETACRCGELTGITWDDVDLKKKCLTIDKQLVYRNFGTGKCEFRVVPPKTEAGDRKIPLSDEACKAFRDLRNYQRFCGVSCNTIVNGYSKFCFLTGSGKPMATNGVNFFLKNIVEAYNKENQDQPLPHISAHILRHTACTLIAEQGIDIKALQDFMGHSDASITLNVYNHSTFERTQRELEKIKSVVSM